MKLLSAILFCLCFTGIAKADTVLNPTDQNGINQALAAGGTVYLNAGTYDITGPINLPANTVLTGDSNGIIQVSSSSSQWFTGNTGIITCSDPQNIEVQISRLTGISRIYHTLTTQMIKTPTTAKEQFMSSAPLAAEGTTSLFQT
jgi:hypothetical protein